jgi:hypothetical protein
MTGRVLVFIEDAWFWLTGGECPICGQHAWSWCHKCPALKGLSDQATVNLLLNKVRNILDDEPADRFVHGAYEACEKLESVFTKAESPEEKE